MHSQKRKAKKKFNLGPRKYLSPKFFFAPNLLLVPRCQVFPAKTLLNANVRSFRQLVFAKLHKTTTKRTKSNGKGCWRHLNSSANYFIVHQAFSWNRRTSGHVGEKFQPRADILALWKGHFCSCVLIVNIEKKNISSSVFSSAPKGFDISRLANVDESGSFVDSRVQDFFCSTTLPLASTRWVRMTIKPLALSTV